MHEFMTSSGMFNLAQVCGDLYKRVADQINVHISNEDGSLIQNVFVGEQIENIQKELMHGSTNQIKMYDS